MIRQLTTLSLVALIAGCASQKAESPKPTSAFNSSRNPEWLSPDLYPNGAVPAKEPVVRYGRYTLVSTEPGSSQRDLMAQIIDVTIPSGMSPSIRDAMLYVVDRSGYTLCSPSTPHVNILYTRPLPAAQYKLGPMTLRNTLQVLAGPAWQVKVDEVNRQVCFVLRPGYQLPDPVASSAQLYAAKSPTTLPPPPPPADKASAVVVTAVPSASAITAVTPKGVQGSTSTTQTLSPVVPAKDGPTIHKAVPSVAPSSSAVPITSLASSSAEASKKAVPAVTTAPQQSPIPNPAPVSAKPLPEIWTASTGSTLRQSVEAWAQKANWTLLWEPEDLDYPIAAPLRFEGSFEEAIKQVFPLYDKAPRSFVVDGSAAQRLIHIAERKKK